ncbi:hypothetical protein E4U56_005798 [Claviceps arundinis]|uniref:Uncharacterized protein n=1 Tax=Claviceps arundinis TaxID=1623583 RepID=A0A9P7MLH4_9HYPO|nr:hypothetical protein E4U56_005798 [Claviceps arundinis]
MTKDGSGEAMSLREQRDVRTEMQDPRGLELAGDVGCEETRPVVLVGLEVDANAGRGAVGDNADADFDVVVVVAVAATVVIVVVVVVVVVVVAVAAIAAV